VSVIEACRRCTGRACDQVRALEKWEERMEGMRSDCLERGGFPARARKVLRKVLQRTQGDHRRLKRYSLYPLSTLEDVCEQKFDRQERLENEVAK
jgi:hypothetical protein